MEQTKYRNYMLTVLTLVYAFNFVDGNALGMLMEAIKTDLKLTDTQMGLLSGIAFAVFYSTLGIPIARWADRGNRITIISLTTVLWSAMVLCCGLATTYVQLLVARMGVAVGEAGCVPPAQSLIADYYSRKERARAMSLYMLGAPLAVILGTALAGWVNELHGWRTAFFVVGAPGVFLALLVRFTLHEPRLRQAALTQRWPTAQAKTGNIAVFKTLWRQLAYRHLTIGYTLIYLFSFGVAQWVPTFLIRTYHIDTGELGSWYAVIWGVGGMVGTLAGGQLSSRLAADNERLQLKAMAFLLLGFIPLYLGIYSVNNLGMVFGLMTIGALLYAAMFGPLFAMIQQVVAPNMRAISIALVLFLANLIGMGIGPMAVGAMSDLLAPHFGEDSLRMALVVWTPGYLWAVFHLLWARRYVRDDIESSRAEDSTMAAPAVN